MALKAVEIHITTPEQQHHSFNLLESLSGVDHVVDHDDGAAGHGSRHGGQPLDRRTKTIVHLAVRYLDILYGNKCKIFSWVILVCNNFNFHTSYPPVGPLPAMPESVTDDDRLYVDEASEMNQLMPSY